MSRPWEEAREAIAERIAHAADVLLFLNFDGTLAPLVEDPTRAALPAATAQLLQRLNTSPRATVAVISGRERADLQARVGIPGLVYVGNHGLEISGSGFLYIEPTAVGHRTALQGLAKEIGNRIAAIEGASVEDKGLTVSVHHRKAKPEAHEQIRQYVHAALANSSHPFYLTTGDMVYEIRPRITWNKGTVVGWVREQIDKPDALVIYIGSVATDEDAFAALPDAVTVKVGEGDSAAAYRVAGPLQVRQLLEWLVEVLGTIGSRPSGSQAARRD